MILEGHILRSEIFAGLPMVHGFTTRGYGNLGFGKNPGDPEVVENRRKLFNEPELAGRIHIQPRQVHSARAVTAADFVPGIEADAVFTNSNQHLLSILTADCVPILVYHPSGVVAAIHAGWRGLYHEVIPRTLALIPAGSVAAVGPAIGVCCYEVSPELADEFEAKFGPDGIDRSHSRPHLDLIRVAVKQVQTSGVEALEVAHLCTFCHPELFFSYRRDGSSGRMMSFIGLK
jgi:YfiH family protein